MPFLRIVLYCFNPRSLRRERLVEITRYLASADEVDIAERAYQFVRNAIAENKNNFSRDARQVWGELTDDYVFFNKNVLCRIMNDEGFDFEAVKSKWDERRYLEKSSNGRFVHYRSIFGAQAYYVKLALNPSGQLVEIDDDEDLPF